VARQECRTQRVWRTSAGLINQQYILIAAIVFAKALGAELVLPSAVHRRSFSDEQAAMEWRSAPFASVWDEDHLIRYWAARGLVLHKARVMTGLGRYLSRRLRVRTSMLRLRI